MGYIPLMFIGHKKDAPEIQGRIALMYDTTNWTYTARFLPHDLDCRHLFWLPPTPVQFKDPDAERSVAGMDLSQPLRKLRSIGFHIGKHKAESNVREISNWWKVHFDEFVMTPKGKKIVCSITGQARKYVGPNGEFKIVVLTGLPCINEKAARASLWKQRDELMPGLHFQMGLASEALHDKMGALIAVMDDDEDWESD